MSDDGLIVLRTVRQILAGNGPVFNIGERVEGNTSTLWTAVLVLVGWAPGVSLEWIAVIVGLLFSAAGLLLGLDGARRMAGPAASTFVFPAGALVVLALPPFRDFATSGLETGLISLWLGGTWWLLVRRGTEQQRGPLWSTAVVIGLGPFVRPDLALFTQAAMVGLLVLTWQGWRHTLIPVAAAAVLPVLYQVFRMGYYGLITPNTALAKEASEALWDSGWAYFGDFTDPYFLWIPVAACLLTGFALLWRKTVSRRVVVLVAVPVIAGVMLVAYVVRVGGDFMHGRMLLPATFCLLLPVMAIRVTKLTFVPVVVVAAWAVVAGGWLRTPYAGLEEPIDDQEVIADERAAYVAASGTEHPILARDFRLFKGMADDANQQLAAQLNPVILVYASSTGCVAYPSANGRDVLTYFNIGGPGMLLPLDVWVRDPIGLANPVAAHSTTCQGDASGTANSPVRTGRSPASARSRRGRGGARPVHAGRPRRDPHHAQLPAHQGNARLRPRAADLRAILGEPDPFRRPKPTALRPEPRERANLRLTLLAETPSGSIVDHQPSRAAVRLTSQGAAVSPRL
ncbi:arabinofuranosyltransferase [Amycolatopsis sp. NPDC051071]|uniref:arabinofuranosyltransferase n=1 Tax=Amycolatopsis sp. NPDC051071 TaxID=3154637 RepID=UPI00341B5B31